MSEPRIGRVLVASLHQAIADLLPNRLEFYENWLNVSGLREGTIGLAPLFAVLSFLRTEGEAYNFITSRAGEYAADWTVNNLGPLERRVIRALPARLRARAALRTARALVRDTYPGSRAIVRFSAARPPSICADRCSARSGRASMLPLCGFYASAYRACAAAVRPSRRRARKRMPRRRRRKGCLLSVVVSGASVDESGGRRLMGRMLEGHGFAAVSSSLLAARLRRGPSACRRADRPRRILVVPFENTQREPRLHWLAEASAVLLADELNARASARSRAMSACAHSNSCISRCRRPSPRPP